MVRDFVHPQYEFLAAGRLWWIAPPGFWAGKFWGGRLANAVATPCAGTLVRWIKRNTRRLGILLRILAHMIEQGLWFARASWDKWAKESRRQVARESCQKKANSSAASFLLHFLNHGLSTVIPLQVASNSRGWMTPASAG